MSDLKFATKSASNYTHFDMPVKSYHLRTMERAKEYILEHFTQDMSLHSLAEYCYVSQFHFCRLFKQFFGCSPFRYVQQVRLNHAEMLMRTTDLPVTDICFRSGFSRLDYFSATFTKRFGESPLKYRGKQMNKIFSMAL